MRWLLFLAMLAGARLGCAPLDDSQPVRPSLTLAPAIVLAKTKPGQGLTQTLRMTNTTSGTFHFVVEVQDVAVKDTRRVYLPPGEADASIAASAVVTPRELTIGPQQEGSATITLTIPEKTQLRAVVVYFKGQQANSGEGGSVGLGASLGALITFELSQDYKFEPAAFSVSPQTDATNEIVSHELLNSGPEIVVPKGSTAILDDSGKRVAKATFNAQRILPGEHVTFSATCPEQLKPGHYRAISTFEFASHVMTAQGEFTVQ